MIKLIKSTFYEEEKTKKLLTSFIERAEQLSFGKECEKFEAKFSNWQGRNETVFVNSGSSANLALIQALKNLSKVNEGDRIGFSAVTWSTNVMPLIQLGFVPIPVDVELNTLNISVETLIQAYEKHKIKMLFLTNLLGFCGEIDKIVSFCRENNIILIEDNCESLGSVYKGKKLGNFGLASTFSFYVGHHMSTVEGGAICTDNLKLATMLRIVRAHGWDRNLKKRPQTKIRKEHQVNEHFYSRYTFYDLGFNLRPTEITGFLGLVQLKYLDKIIERRERNFMFLSGRLNDLTDRYYSLNVNHMDLVSNFAYPLICTSQNLKDELVQRCVDMVEIRPIVAGNIAEQPFYKKYVGEFSYIKNANVVHKQGLYFGNNPELIQEELNLIVKIFSN
jgi:CDP-4-dehydro-6-deoxyglucose reductase, E1